MDKPVIQCLVISRERTQSKQNLVNWISLTIGYFVGQFFLFYAQQIKLLGSLIEINISCNNKLKISRMLFYFTTIMFVKQKRFENLGHQEPSSIKESPNK